MAKLKALSKVAQQALKRNRNTVNIPFIGGTGKRLGEREVPRYFYHSVRQRGFNEAGGISKYDVPEGAGGFKGIVYLSRKPMDSSAVKIDVSKLPNVNTRTLEPTFQSEGHYLFKGDIPAKAIRNPKGKAQGGMVSKQLKPRGVGAAARGYGRALR